jgi:hypothetical protein
MRSSSFALRVERITTEKRASRHLNTLPVGWWLRKQTSDSAWGSGYRVLLSPPFFGIKDLAKESAIIASEMAADDSYQQ